MTGSALHSSWCTDCRERHMNFANESADNAWPDGK
jgi:hypothetical protein